MLVWINGAFGAGETQNAHELHRRVDGSRSPTQNCWVSHVDYVDEIVGQLRADGVDVRHYACAAGLRGRPTARP
jgi:hypothetical protein